MKTAEKILAEVTGMSEGYLFGVKKDLWTITPDKIKEAMEIYAKQSHPLKEITDEDIEKYIHGVYENDDEGKLREFAFIAGAKAMRDNLIKKG